MKNQIIPAIFGNVKEIANEPTSLVIKFENTRTKDRMSQSEDGQSGRLTFR